MPNNTSDTKRHQQHQTTPPATPATPNNTSDTKTTLKWHQNDRKTYRISVFRTVKTGSNFGTMKNRKQKNFAKIRTNKIATRDRYGSSRVEPSHNLLKLDSDLTLFFFPGRIRARPRLDPTQEPKWVSIVNSHVWVDCRGNCRTRRRHSVSS